MMTTPTLAISPSELLVSGLICGMGVLLAAAYLLTSRPQDGRHGLWQMESDEAFARRMRRRRLGAALLAAISIGFFIGINVLEPGYAPTGYILYWTTVLTMVIWLIVLGILDLRQTRRMVQDHRHRRHQDQE